jgi:phage terminase large subunit GpA-like protein
MADAEGCDRTNDEGVPVTASPLATGIRDGIKLAFAGTILDWAEENVRFPASDRASRFDRSVAPWMNEPLLAASDDETTQVFVRAATGAGKTTYMEGIACFIVAQKPGPTLFVGQTDDMVKDWTESRLLPIFHECAPVRALFPEDRHALRKTTILFPHMVLFAGGANMTNLQEKSMRYCIGDEVWRWKHGMIRELKARHHDRWNRKTLLVSQGWDSGHEADAEWDSGTREAWGWECEGCGNWHRYTWDDIKYEVAKNEQGEMLWDAVQDSVRMECPTCQHAYRDTAAVRRALSARASYRALNPHPVRGHRSFEFPAYAVWWIPWFSIVREWIEAQESKNSGNLEPLKQFVQKRKAQVWVEEVTSSLPEVTTGDYAKADFIDGQLIDGEHRRFMTVDVQRDHFWAVVRAFRVDGSSMLLHESRPLTWETLDAIAAQYNVQGRCVVVDAGFDTAIVYEQCARRGWTASHGSGQDGFYHMTNSRRVRKFVSKIETAVAGSDNLRCFYFFFSNEGIKDKLAALRQPGATPKWEVPRDVSEDYRKQMLAEMKKDIINSRTKQVEQRWVKIGGRPNHLWDCECIALASAMLAGVMPVGAES